MDVIVKDKENIIILGSSITTGHLRQSAHILSLSKSLDSRWPVTISFLSKKEVHNTLGPGLIGPSRLSNNDNNI